MLCRIAALALGLLGLPGVAWACSCTNAGPRAAFQRSAAVFLGRVTHVGLVRQGQYGAEGTVRLLVQRSMKGVQASDTAVVNYEAVTSCAVEFVQGREYLVYTLRAADGRLWTNYCTGTTVIECAAPDLQALGEPLPARARDCTPRVRVPRERLAEPRRPAS
jgi:hypothetical protein